MTLAAGFAARTETGGSVWVMSDSRISFGEAHADTGIKALSLGANSAAVAAGSSSPFLFAVEGARPWIIVNERDQASRGKRLSVWSEAGLIWVHLELIFSEFAAVLGDARVAIIVVGFFSDHSPGIVRIDRVGEDRSFRVFRPRLGERMFTVAGVESYAPILAEAVRRSAPPKGKSYHDVASVLWDIIKHEGRSAENVGGGISLGFSNGGSETFQWPLVEIEGQVFMRGLRYPPHVAFPPPMKLHYNPYLFTELDVANGATALGNIDHASREYVSENGTENGDPRLFVAQNDDGWLLEVLERQAR